MKRKIPKRVGSKTPKGQLVVRISGKNIPKYQSERAAGCDLYAALKKTVVLKPAAFLTIPTGIIIEIPTGYEAQVRPRSGLAKNHGIGILNAPGTIDADYRGEIMVILYNLGQKPFMISPKDRIAQLVFSRVEQADFRKVKRLNKTTRGRGGFGHSGIGRKKKSGVA